MKGFLVTGGCGFIGSHLVDSLLSDGYQVRVLDDLSTGQRENIANKCELFVGDITDSNLVRSCMKNMDGCFHLADIASVQESNKDWLRAHQVNLTGTINVFDASRKNKTPVVYASSAAVYGDNAEMPLKEGSVTRPLTAYGADKIASELHAQITSLVHGVPTTGMRFFNVYGPRQNSVDVYSGVISLFVERILEQKSLCIYGDGQQARDFIHVNDAVQFLRAAMNNVSRIPTVFNVCTGELVTINQLAKMVKSISGLNVPIEHHASHRGDIRVSVGDPDYAKKMLAVTAVKPLVRGLQQIIVSMRNEYLMNLKTTNNITIQSVKEKSDRRQYCNTRKLPVIDCDGISVDKERRVNVHLR